MKQFSKGFAFFINLANYAAGISVALILLLKRDFTSILYINGMTTNESLFFNMIMFVTGLALAGIVLYLIVKENKKLKVNKTYYIRIRTYVKVNGKNVYSKWSSKKKIVTK